MSSSIKVCMKWTGSITKEAVPVMPEHVDGMADLLGFVNDNELWVQDFDYSDEGDHWDVWIELEGWADTYVVSESRGSWNEPGYIELDYEDADRMCDDVHDYFVGEGWTETEWVGEPSDDDYEIEDDDDYY